MLQIIREEGRSAAPEAPPLAPKGHFFFVPRHRFFLFMAAYLILILAMALPCPALADNAFNLFEIKITDISKTQANQLARSGINIINRRDTTVWADVTPDQYQGILDQGYAVEIVVPETRKTSTPLQASGYPSYDDVVTQLNAFQSNYPDICKVVDIGQSYQGRDLLFLKISDNVNIEEDEPEFKYISTMHGNEPVGTDLMLKLINYLMDNYESADDEGQRVTNLVDNMEIWIMPLMNPDGYVIDWRYNLQSKDLNRTFPERTGDNVNTLVDKTGIPRPTEVQRVMTWAFNHSPVLSANFHTGKIVANYPFDSNFSGTWEYTPTPDDDLFKELALTYSRPNNPMYTSLEFEDGITNGADWYEVLGGMQDWNYVWMGCMEITIELSNDFAPDYSLMGDYWDDNRESLLAYMEWALKGVRGVVTDKCTGQPISATITVEGSDFQAYTDPDVGDYHRILLPSANPYTLTVSATGYETRVITGVMVLEGDATRLDVELETPPVPGDINCNGCLGVEDAIIVLQILAGMDPTIGVCPEAQPVFDAKLGLDDALYILRETAQIP
ncbi:MAG: carboxypeptidase regulatory-like domain-containing protein [Desulfatibacillum sp.]|nr:carboxypeptidase regulatory-like domain-containing protein [Desulfatibacillum sp.]